MRLGYNIGKIFAKLPLRRTTCTSNLLKPTTRSMLVKHCGLAPSAPCCTALARQACFASLVPRRVQVAPAPPRHAAVLLYAPARLIRSQATARAGPIHITFCARRVCQPLWPRSACLILLAESASRCGRAMSCLRQSCRAAAALDRLYLARLCRKPPPWPTVATPPCCLGEAPRQLRRTSVQQAQPLSKSTISSQAFLGEGDSRSGDVHNIKGVSHEGHTHIDS